MTIAEATTEVFYTAFRALPRKERQALLLKLTEDEELRDDLIDIAIGQQRMRETARPLKEVLEEIKTYKRG